MRQLPPNLTTQIFKRKQTKALGSEISTSMVVSRAFTPLIYPELIDEQMVNVGTLPITDTSIAVRHPQLDKKNDMIFIAYIQSGIGKMSYARTKYKMSAHEWIDCGLNVENILSICVAFDGTMPVNKKDEIQFVTEKDPWIFWVTNDGKCCGKKYNTDSIVELASSDCTKVSAIRSFWSESGDFDFGLCVFMLLNRHVYYRQYIKGEWKDGREINFRSSFGYETEPKIVDIRADRTWDYRTILQLKTTDGKTLRIITQFEGIAKNNFERIDVNVNIDKKDLIAIRRNTTRSLDEHIDLNSGMTKVEEIYGLSVVPINVQNIPDENNDYGYYVEITFDYPVSNVNDIPDNFKLMDNENNYISCLEVEQIDENKIRLKFNDFNYIGNDVATVIYDGEGDIMSPATTTNAFSVEFNPINLKGITEFKPYPVEVYNL